MDVLSVISYLALFGVVCSLAYYIAAAFFSIRFAAELSTPPPPLPAATPEVALLKPIHGVGSRLVENLKSFLSLDYPKAKLIVGLDSEAHPAAAFLAKLKETNPSTPIYFCFGEDPTATNHKVGKLIKMVELASDCEILVLSDADVSVEPELLRRLVGELNSDKRVGVVTCLYRAKPVGGVGSRLDALFVNTDFVPMALLSHAFEAMGHAFGATIAIKKQVLDCLQGFKKLKNMLADDFLIGKFAVDCGYEVKLSRTLVTIWSEESKFLDFWRHQIRWARTYRTVRPISIATIIIHGPFWALAFLAASTFSQSSILLALVLLIARLIFAAILIKTVLRLELRLSDLFLTVVKDFLMTAIWFASLLGNEVSWGGRRFKLLSTGELQEIATS